MSHKLYRSPRYYSYKSKFSKISLPKDLERRVNSLVSFAVASGVLGYIAYASAIRYVLEHEAPEYLLKVQLPELPIKGYAKCLRIWSELGIVKHTPRREAVLRAINSPFFDEVLEARGVDSNLIGIIKERIIRMINGGGVPKGDLGKALMKLLSAAIGDFDVTR